MSVNVSERRKLGKWFSGVLRKSKRLPKVLREILYGMTVHEMNLELRRERGVIRCDFYLILFPPSTYGREVF
jgi:hypothetical protein